jgi:hypothetical protein
MANRGRPKKDGIEEFIIMNLVLHTYNQARCNGEKLKHSSAVREAVAKVRACFPDVPGFPPVRISETAVKRILAQFQPQGFADALVVTRIGDTELRQNLEIYQAVSDQAEAVRCPELLRRTLREIAEVTEKMKVGFSFGYGPRPEYPRHNAGSS